MGQIYNSFSLEAVDMEINLLKTANKEAVAFQGNGIRYYHGVIPQYNLP
ncbi:hypothetical protein [Fluviicola sp.]|jgi:hypothetical protein|nr:hypothetical protein [Fluviicola sp.]MDR0801176.1 hypothetical protein [Fluviicola sp.]